MIVVTRQKNILNKSSFIAKTSLHNTVKQVKSIINVSHTLIKHSVFVNYERYIAMQPTDH